MKKSVLYLFLMTNFINLFSVHMSQVVVKNPLELNRMNSFLLKSLFEKTYTYKNKEINFDVQVREKGKFSDALVVIDSRDAFDIVSTLYRNIVFIPTTLLWNFINPAVIDFYQFIKSDEMIFELPNSYVFLLRSAMRNNDYPLFQKAIETSMRKKIE